MFDQSIINPAGEKLDHRFARATADHPVRNWIVILGHGVTGDLDRPVVAATAAALNAAGFDTLRFSFAGNGGSEGDFRDATITKEVADLGAVVDAASAIYPKIAVVGHSMGAAVAVLRAAGDLRIAALVSLAGMVNTRRFAETEFGEVTPDVGCMWDEPECPLSQAYMDDLCRTIFSVVPHAEKVTVPWLLVHGTADDVVLPDDTQAVAGLRGDDVAVRFIDGADHSFTDPDHQREMTRAVANWLVEVASFGGA